MCYNWNVNDDTMAITTGAGAALQWGGVIQDRDGYGGYNTNVTLPAGVLGQYHVHFRPNSTQVQVIRFQPADGGQGTNVVMLQDGCKGVTLNQLFKDTNILPGYPNSKLLLQHLAQAVTNVPKGANGQYQ